MNSQIDYKKTLYKLLFKPRIIVFVSFHIIYLVLVSSKKIWHLKKASSIYFLNIGGFGHTIAQADIYLNYIDENGKVILIYTPGMHNKAVSLLYPNKYFLIDRSKLFFMIDPKSERHAIHFAERIVLRIIHFFLSLLSSFPNIYDWNSLLEIVEINKASSVNQRVLELFYSLFGEKKSLDFMTTNKNSFETLGGLEKRLTQEFKGQRFCAFYYRKKGVEGSDQMDNYLRNSRKISDFIPLFEQLKSFGFSTLLYGDEPDIIEDDVRRSGVIFHSDLDWEKEEWDIWAAKIGEFTIGGPGGGLLLPIKFFKKVLVIDGFGYWYGIPNAVHTYKLVFSANKHLISPFTMLHSDPNNLNFPEGSYIEHLPQSLFPSLLAEFFSYFENWPKDDLISFDLHYECWLNIAPNAIVSKKYIEYVDSIS